MRMFFANKFFMKKQNKKKPKYIYISGFLIYSTLFFKTMGPKQFTRGNGSAYREEEQMRMAWCTENNLTNHQENKITHYLY